MLSSITPLGEQGRNNRFAVAASFFVAGSSLGGAIVGGVAGGLGAWLVPDRPSVAATVVVALALLGAALDARLGGVHLPTITRQVDERWLHKYRGWVYGFGFGVQLGTGVATIITSAAVYVMLLAALLTRSFVAGVAIGVTFGFVRGASILLARHVRTPEQLRAFHRALATNAMRSRRAGVAVQLVAATVGVMAIVTVR